MERSFNEIYRVENGFLGIEMMGRTDPAILKEALINHDLEWKEEEVERFKKVYFIFLQEEIQKPRSGKRLCPGIRSLLSHLQKQSNIVLGLLTGNWRRSGLTKLSHFGIDGYFRIGAYGDDSPHREDLVPIVIERLKERQEIEVTKADVYVIGDTPLDIRCARPHGVRTVGVATGFHSLEELAVEEPDYLFPNFENMEEVVEAFCRL